MANSEEYLRGMTTTITELCRYPVKGLGPDRMEEATITMGEGLPFDRKWGMIHDTSEIDPATTLDWAKAQNFIRLSKDEKIAQLDVAFDEETRTLTLFRKGKQVSRGRLDDPTGRMLLQSFMSGFMPAGPRGNPKIVQASSGGSFVDTEGARISFINHASLRDLERVTREPVSPDRMRGNIYIDGLPAWAEFDWVGKRIRVGEATLEVTMRIDRCAATNVNPKNGEIDMNIPLSLRKGFGHIDCGVHAKVIMGGTIRPGDEITVA